MTSSAPLNSRTQKVLVAPDATLQDTLRVIDANALGIALVADEKGRLLGTVTDGDVRRSLLAGNQLTRQVAEVMNRDPVTVAPNTDMQEVRRIFIESTLKQVPVVDDGGRVVDILTVADLLSIPLSLPDISEREIHAVLNVLRTTDLSLGPKAVEFERKVATYAQRDYAIAVNSGTSGLHLVVRSLGIGKGDEVITTPFSFIASSNCILYEHATPVFVDIEPDTYNIDPAGISAAVTPRTKAILAVDVFGQPARYDALDSIARANGLHLISDCCESIGAEYRGRRSSTFGVAGVFGFYPNKQMTTGEGGVVITDDRNIADLCYSMRNQGRGDQGGWLLHERLGYNYRLPEVSCALGIEQLERLDDILERRNKTALLYNDLLKSVPGVSTPVVSPETTRMSWFVYVIRLADQYSRAQRDEILQYLRRHGIGVASYFAPIHLQPFYREMFGLAPGAFPITERVSERTLALPFHSNMMPKDCEKVVDHLTRALVEVDRQLSP